MTDPEVSALIAFLVGGLLSVLLVVPYIAWSYRRRGELGLGHALLAFGFLVYAMALWTYTLLPVPDTTPQFCAENAVRTMQTRPLQFFADIRRDQVGTGVRALLHNPALQQAVFNVALFVPLGMFGRHLLRLRPLTVIALGAAVSLFIEVTQRTAVWGLFACPYRLFDVDDLITNTLGAALGLALAPALRLMPGQKVRAAADEPRPVTTARRLLGMAVDLVSVALLGATFQVVYNIVAVDLLIETVPDQHRLLTIAAPVALLLVLVPMLGNGGTFGQRVVLLRPVGPDGGKPGLGRMLARFAAGSGGFFVLEFFGVSLLGFLLLAVSGVMAWRPKDHRGLSGVVAGLRVVDSRDATFREPASVINT
ncbi:membrane protein, putative [Alloactinosynnema sp. L-07]|uniref:VanZ family protein n=1 Tax=Alloactinosynnema sp. L-07 TaxID=1653480 RepID=UPI00065EF445|nr:VanZ family protein [Alloactinosynnema sp. L-07]CRK60323.1 membrane protein, putative [Alloactinosynnema sp. L-07]